MAAASCRHATQHLSLSCSVLPFHRWCCSLRRWRRHCHSQRSGRGAGHRGCLCRCVSCSTVCAPAAACLSRLTPLLDKHATNRRLMNVPSAATELLLCLPCPLFCKRSFTYSQVGSSSHGRPVGSRALLSNAWGCPHLPPVANFCRPPELIHLFFHHLTLQAFANLQACTAAGAPTVAPPGVPAPPPAPGAPAPPPPPPAQGGITGGTCFGFVRTEVSKCMAVAPVAPALLVDR